MDFLTANFVTGGRDPSKGVDNPSLNPALGGRSYAQLANLATDGRSSSWHQQVTAVFLRRCYLESVEHHEDFRTVSNSDSDEAQEASTQVLSARANDCVPSGNYDRWLVFTDLIGWESDAYYDAIEHTVDTRMADLDDPSAIPAYVLYRLAENCMFGLIREFKKEDEYNHGSAE